MGWLSTTCCRFVQYKLPLKTSCLKLRLIKTDMQEMLLGGAVYHNVTGGSSNGGTAISPGGGGGQNTGYTPLTLGLIN